MAYTPKQLYQGQPGTSYATAYTATAVSCILREVVVANPTAGSVTLDLSVVASGGTAGVTNNIIPNAVIGGYSVVIFSFSTVMAPSGFISAKASAAASLTLTISGVEFT